MVKESILRFFDEWICHFYYLIDAHCWLNTFLLPKNCVSPFVISFGRYLAWATTQTIHNDTTCERFSFDGKVETTGMLIRHDLSIAKVTTFCAINQLKAYYNIFNVWRMPKMKQESHSYIRYISKQGRIIWKKNL